MNKLTLKVFLTIVLLFSFYSVFAYRIINAKFTSNAGCKIQIVGYIDNDGQFHGDVILSGGSKCPKGTLTFGRLSSNPNTGGLKASLNNKKIEMLTKVTWTSTSREYSQYIKILNEEKINNALVSTLKAAKDE